MDLMQNTSSRPDVSTPSFMGVIAFAIGVAIHGF